MQSVTIWQNKIGHLHIFIGYGIRLHYEGPNSVLREIAYKATDNKGNTYTIPAFSQSDLYFQTDADIQAIIETLTPHQKESLNAGWQIATKIDNLYFGG